LEIPLECPTCGKTGDKSGDWAKGGFRGTLIGGLDPANCAGCWDTLTQSGAAPLTFTPDGNGGYASASIPRPSEEQS
jgi:hypothetical protein